MIIPHTSYLQGAFLGMEAPVWLQEAWPGTKDSQTRVNPSAHHKENGPHISPTEFSSAAEEAYQGVGVTNTIAAYFNQ